MKKIVKSLSIVICMFLALGQGVLFVACSRDKVSNDPKIVNVRVYKGGYGADWVYELERRFEKAYAEEGYQMNILTPSLDNAGNVVVTELAAGHAKSKIDLYFTAGVTMDMVTSGSYGMLVEDISESVLAKPAIGYDKQEESIKINEKATAETLKYMQGSDGKGYGFNWVQSVAGFAVNTKKLAKYGLDLPKTTNEMLNAFDVIYKGTTHNGVTIENSEKTKTFPITYVQGDNGYTLCMLNVMLAQYEGIDGYGQYWSMVDADGKEMVDNGMDVFKTQGVLEMLKVAFQTFDANIASYGTTQQGVDQAQAQIMRESGDNAIFMANGDWMLNEVKLNFKNLDDIGFMNFPVISALGTKLFGSGTSYAMTETESESLLSYIIGLVDKNMTIEDIIADVNTNKAIDVDAESVNAIAKARGVYYARGIEHAAFITKDAKSKDVAELVLRMFASDDFSRDFAKYSNASSPYAKEKNTQTEYKFVEQASEIAVNRYMEVLAPNVRGLRKKVGLANIFSHVPHIPIYINGLEVSMYHDGKQIADENVYYDAANKMRDAEVNNVTDNWSKWLETAGVSR